MSVLLPSTGRPERLASCVERLRDTTHRHDVELVAAIDADRDSVAALLALDFQHLKVHIDYSETLRGCSNAWNAALKASRGDPVVFAADDLEWQDGWLDAALAALEENPGCMVGFNDGHWGPELSTHYLLPREFICDVLGGVVAWPFYKHSFNDLETTERARRADRYVWCEDARVYHSHWLFGDRTQDDTDLRRLPDHPEDEAHYKRRRTAGFPNDFEPVIEC